MTQKERMVLISLIFFLLVGIGRRLYRSHDSKVDFEVGEFKSMTQLNEKFEKLRLEAASVDLNNAQTQDFEKLPGIGPKRAQAIVQYRKEIGRFLNPQELMKVKGFGKARYESLKKYILVKPSKNLRFPLLEKERDRVRILRARQPSPQPSPFQGEVETAHP